MAGAFLPFGGLCQVLHDPAVTCFLIGVATSAEHVQLPFKHAKRVDLLVDSLDLPIDHLVDLITGQFRVRLKVAQRAHIRQPYAERAAMANEVELDQVRFGVAAITIGLAFWEVKETFTLVEPHCFNVATAVLCQFTDSHPKVLKDA